MIAVTARLIITGVYAKKPTDELGKTP